MNHNPQSENKGQKENNDSNPNGNSVLNKKTPSEKVISGDITKATPTNGQNNPPADEKDVKPPDRWEKKHSTWNIWVQTLLAVFNLVMIGLFIVSMTNQEKYTRQSIDLTRKSDSASEAMRKIELRAYVYIKRMKINNFLEEKIITGDITIENTGRTPANRFNYIWGRKYNGEKVNDKDFDSIKKFDTAFGINIYPGAPNRADISFPDNPNISRSDIMSGKTTLYIFGIMRYYDVFGDYEEIRTIFYYDPITKIFYYKNAQKPTK